MRCNRPAFLRRPRIRCPGCRRSDGRRGVREIDAFLRADADGDARLSAREFRTLVAEMAEQGQPKAAMIRFFGAYSYAFSIADADRDCQLVLGELRLADDDY